MINWVNTDVVLPPKDGTQVLAFWCGVPLYVQWVTAEELPDIYKPDKCGNVSYEGAWKDALGGLIYNDPAFWAYINLPERVKQPLDSDGYPKDCEWAPNPDWWKDPND